MCFDMQAYNFFGRDDPSVEIPACLQPTHIGEDLPASVVNPAPPTRPQKKILKKKARPRKSKKDCDSDGDADNEQYRWLFL